MTQQQMAPKIQLNNGQQMPILGIGTWRSYESDAEKACKYALDCGYRHIDTAFVYENEVEVGRAIRTKITEGLIRREDVFVVTKLGGIHHDPKLVQHACQLSLNNLDIGYIDLYLMHFPVGQVYHGDSDVHGSGQLTDVDYLDTWKEMEKLVDTGKVRGIGLSNFNSEQIDRVLKNCRIRPVVNQVECHPAFNQKKLIKFCQERNIVVTAYCPLARPQPENRWPAFIYDATAEAMARKYKKTPAQICLRYLIQIGTVPIPKSVSKHRIEENFGVFDFELDEDDVKVMDQYNTDKRMIPFSGMRHHKYYPFSIEF